MISVGVASIRSRTALEGRTLVAESTSILGDVCLMRTAAGCSVHINQMRQLAAVRVTPGAKPVRSSRTFLAGVSRPGTAEEADVVVDDRAPVLNLFQCCIENDSGRLTIEFASTTGGCTPVQGASSYAIADAGGIRIFGKGSSGGGIVVGGACARARIDQIELSAAEPSGDEPVAPIPASSVVVKTPPDSCPVCSAGPQVLVGPPRIVTRELVSYRTRGAPAWRTAGAWGPALGTLAALVLLGWTLRRRPVMQPVLGGINRFMRQFVRG
jgi:hypothetical protein